MGGKNKKFWPKHSPLVTNITFLMHLLFHLCNHNYCILQKNKISLAENYVFVKDKKKWGNFLTAKSASKYYIKDFAVNVVKFRIF